MRATGLMMVVLVAGLTAGCTTAPTELEPEPIPSQTVVPVPIPENSSSIVDSGPREGATGTIALNSNGTPWKYTVAEGDTADDICVRFNLWWDQLSINGERLTKHPLVYTGDVLTIVAHDPANQP